MNYVIRSLNDDTNTMVPNAHIIVLRFEMKTKYLFVKIILFLNLVTSGD